MKKFQSFFAFHGIIHEINLIAITTGQIYVCGIFVEHSHEIFPVYLEKLSNIYPVIFHFMLLNKPHYNLKSNKYIKNLNNF